MHADLERIKSGLPLVQDRAAIRTLVGVGAALLILAAVSWLYARVPASRSKAAPSPAAELYLKGRYYWDKRTPEDLHKAVGYFTQSISANPRYAKAYVGLADSYGLLREFAAMPNSEAWPLALAAARKAVELDDTSAEAHASLAFDLFYGSFDLKGGEREFKRAVKLNPNYAEAHHWYATALMSVGRLSEASDEMERARELDPSSRSIMADQGLILFYRGLDKKAVELLRQIETAEPAFLSPHRYLADIYFVSDDCQSYLSESRKAAESSKNPVELAIVAEAEKGFAVGGEQGMFESLLRIQETSAGQGRYPAFLVAKTCARMGRRKDALDYLATSYKRREEYVVALPADPAFSSLHAEPAYQNLLTQLGIDTHNRQIALTPAN
ncbi:MAG TPA: tetratricopeptide repeat protein [Bryobacteraceae bacterium]|nr:tetratricopeptide repeat protein [Bryobacteraceae bacterium]